MSYKVIARFENYNHTYDVHEHDKVYQAPHIGEIPYYVVREDGKQRGAFWDDENRAIEVAEEWAGNSGRRLS